MTQASAVRKLPRWAGLLLAVELVAATLLLRLDLNFYLGDQPLMILFVLPLILSAYFGGMEAGLAATLMAALTTGYFLLPPVNSFKIAALAHQVQWAALWIIGIVVSLLVEALQRSRQRLESSRELLAVTLGSIGDAVIATGRQGRIEFLNAEAERLTGWTAREALDQPLNLVFKVIDEQSRQPAASPVDKILRMEKVVGSADPTVLITKGGREIPIDNSAAPVRQVDGKVHGVVLVFRDGTERKRAEEALKKREKEAQRLAEENAIMSEIGRIISSTLRIEEVYDRFAEEAGKLIPLDRIAIHLFDTEAGIGTLTYVSGVKVADHPAGYSYPLGTVSQELMRARKSLVIQTDDQDELTSYSPGLLTTFQAGLRSMISVPLLSNDRVIGALHIRSTRQKAYTENDVKLSERVGSQIAGAIANAQLFAERKRTQDEKASLQEQLHQSQKMEAIGKLAGGIAHDFNNLLTIINTHAQLGLAELKDWDPLKGKLESIQKAGVRAANLTRQLLAFSRRQVIDTKVIDLNALLQELGKMLTRVIGEDIELNTVLDKDLGRVKADPGQIEQVILNLVVNAKDAMPSGGELTIETANVELDKEYAHTHLEMKSGRYVMLSVSDTGVGMTLEVRERVFEPFFTTKEKGKGTGLGLSTVYGVVKQSGGYIWVYSERGQGTTFKIYLPRVDEPLRGKKAETAVEGVLPGGSETILVVEDEEEVRKLAVAILRKQGYRILEASNGGDAFLICEQGKELIDLLLTDVVMPGLNGPELARRLMYFYPEMKVLYMSGYTDNAILQQGVLDQEMSFLQKPFSLEGLVGKVREVLDRQTNHPAESCSLGIPSQSIRERT